jgi:hypothetical protein
MRKRRGGEKDEVAKKAVARMGGKVELSGQSDTMLLA